MDIIKEIVKYVSFEKLEGVNYSMTTNGVLIDKYLDFLVENDFRISISLDGNKDHNSYRVFSNGENSFNLVEKNVLYIQDKYPLFFSQNINFLSVLNDKSKCESVCKFFERFDKTPLLSTISPENVKKEKITEFKEISGIYVDSEEVDNIKEKYPKIYKSFFDKEYLFKTYLRINDSNSLFSIFNDKGIIFPGKSCMPFEKKVFITTDGYLLPCEKSNQQFCFGQIKNNKIIIYKKKINEYYRNIDYNFKKKCTECSSFLNCNICFFQKCNIIDKGHCRKKAVEFSQEILEFVSSKEI